MSDLPTGYDRSLAPASNIDRSDSNTDHQITSYCSVGRCSIDFRGLSLFVVSDKFL